MAILVDCSQILISYASVFTEDFQKGQSTDKMGIILRHGFLKSMLAYQRDYGAKYGKIVLCFDGNGNWRKRFFKFYKAHRSKNREESTMDWESIFSIVNKFHIELKELFPWKCVRVDLAEGDDVIAVLCKYLEDHELQADGIFELQQMSLILSSDGDFRQLHSKFVHQWSPLQKKFVARPEKDFLVEKIITGDKGDGVPSVLCADDFLVLEEKVRAKPVTVKVIEKFKNKIDLTEEDKARFTRNEQMISFECIPVDISETIIDQYKNAKPASDQYAIMNYFMEQKLTQLMDRLTEF